MFDLPGRLVDMERPAAIIDAAAAPLLLLLAGSVDFYRYRLSKRKALYVMPGIVAFAAASWMLFNAARLSPVDVANWQTADEDGLKCEIGMPGKPSLLQHRAAETARDADLKVYAYQSAHETYTLMVASYRPGVLVHDSLDAIETNIGMAAVSTPHALRDTTLDGMPAREFVIDDYRRRISTIYRCTILGDTAYTLGCTAAFHRINMRNAAAFFSSFKVPQPSR